jgi:hypothetical protein
MEEFYKELLVREKILESDFKNDPRLDIQGQIYELKLIIVRVQQILLDNLNVRS